MRGLRDNAAREASRAYNEKREMEETLKIKNILLLDLKKQFVESQTRLQKCEHDYEYIKNLANRTINLTQSRALALAELKERIKIKQNEEEILKNEGRARQRALQDQSRQIKIAANFLAAYKLEQQKYKNELKTKRDTEDQQNMEINKLLSIVELYVSRVGVGVGVGIGIGVGVWVWCGWFSCADLIVLMWCHVM